MHFKLRQLFDAARADELRPSPQFVDDTIRQLRNLAPQAPDGEAGTFPAPLIDSLFPKLALAASLVALLTFGANFWISLEQPVCAISEQWLFVFN